MRKPEVAERQRRRMRKYSDEDLLRGQLAQSLKLGRTPTWREAIPDAGTYAARFGSYNNAVITAGLQPNVSLPVQYLQQGRPSVRLSLRYAVLKRDGFRCQYCGGTPQDGYVLHVDHRVPHSKGGKRTMDNLVTACMLCNLGKSNT